MLQNEVAVIDEKYWAEFGPVLSTAELARMLRKSDLTVWKWLTDGTIPGHNLGRSWLVYLEPVRRMIEQGPQPGVQLPDELLARYGEELLVSDIAALTGRKAKTVHRWLTEGTLPGHRVGRSWLLYKSEFIGLLRRTSNANPPDSDPDK